ncbi:MAG: hypothetical protein JO250_19595 [Armatimonadetes bacterium]|nr:hypothetical protein [Armatimonadota bacterium]
MTITLDLPPETEARLRLDAGDAGLDIKEYLQKYLDSLPKMTAKDYGRLFSRPLTEEEVQARRDLLQSFNEEDGGEEEGEPGWDLMHALQENPLSLREWHLDD